MCISLPKSSDQFSLSDAVGEFGDSRTVAPQDEFRRQEHHAIGPEETQTAAAVTAAAEEQPDGVTDRQITAKPIRDQVIEYLWDVYQRSPEKRDGRGDFTWKDQAAAERMGVSVQDYVIGGMDPDFREQLYHAGLAMDLAGIRWTVLSGFRDDYRQGIAAGFKAHPGNSFHGGSIATGGYGHGCAVDLASIDGLSNHDVWQWLAVHAAEFGLHRPLPGIDPAHVQPRGAWHDFAAALRRDRLARDTVTAKAETENATMPAATSTHRRDFPLTLEDACTHARLPIQQSKQLTAGSLPPGAIASATSKIAAADRSEHMWFIQLAGGASESVALGGYYRLQRRFSRILGAYRAVIAQAGQTGYRWYRARIAMGSRATADKLCASLRAAGGDCLVLPR
jgi:hypothetical protein